MSGSRSANAAQALRACTIALTASTETVLRQPDAHLVLFLAGRSLGESGQVTAAVSHFQRLAATTCRHLGPDHPDTLHARGNLAFWRGEAGDAAEAAASAVSRSMPGHTAVRASAAGRAVQSRRAGSRVSRTARWTTWCTRTTATRPGNHGAK
ncbi:tetratricopeptide repeat protein [Streptomyces sp. NBC_01477]|uniref:tetratricopeptide repeat protein n=1 Tax=Streptomyces sp. NBC_01477 TaxID=2976015 RepID=UPI002E369564|nr:hypothetical protein [Streptomyces sp. NBC_01477]